MAEAAIASAIFSVFQGVQAKKDSKKAARAQEEIGRQNAMNVEAETAENKRRATDQEAEVSAERRARASASGTGAGGSQQTFMDSEADEFDRQMEWLTKSGAAQADLTRKSANAAAQNTRNQGNAALWGGITSAATSVGSYSGWGGGAASPTATIRTAQPMGASGYGKANWASP